MSKKKAPIVPKPFVVQLAGSSMDGRTNRWKVTCCCGNVFEPVTTYLARQLVRCPKCEYLQSINYNDL